MRKLALFSMLALGLPAIVASVALSAEPRRLTGVSGTVYAVERLDNSTNTLAAFDAATGSVLGVAVVGSRPIGVISPNGSDKVYSADERSNQLSVVSKADLADDGTATAKRIPMGTFPHHMTVSPNGRGSTSPSTARTRSASSTRGSTCASTASTRAATPPPARMPSGSRTTARTSTRRTRVRRRRRSARCRSSTRRRVGAFGRSGRLRPSEVLVTNDGKTAYVTIRNENSVRVLDVSGRASVADRRGRDRHAAGHDAADARREDARRRAAGTPQLALMSTDTRVVRPVTFQGYGISGHQWLSENGKYTFIALESLTTDRPGAIGVVDNDTAQVVETWTYPRGPWPHGVFYEPRVLR